MRRLIVSACCLSLACCATQPRYSQADDGPSGVVKPVDKSSAYDEFDKKWAETIGWLALGAVLIGVGYYSRHLHKDPTAVPPAPGSTICTNPSRPGDPFCKTVP